MPTSKNKRSCSKLVYSADRMGYPIALSFEEHGQLYPTLCGGMTSICVNLILAGFFIMGLLSVSNSSNAIYQQYELP